MCVLLSLLRCTENYHHLAGRVALLELELPVQALCCMHMTAYFFLTAEFLSMDALSVFFQFKKNILWHFMAEMTDTESGARMRGFYVLACTVASVVQGAEKMKL